jgi:two-component system sensor histidine kinase KdpD
MWIVRRRRWETAIYGPSRLDGEGLRAHAAGMIDRPIRPNRSAAAGVLRAYAEAAAMVAISTLAGLAMAPRWGTSAVDLLYLPAVLGAAILGGSRPALFSALVSALAYNYYFTAPQRSLRIDSPADLVTVVILFLVAVTASQLAAAVRRQAQIAGAHAARNATIAGLARRLLSCSSEAEIADVSARQLAELLLCNAVIVGGRPVPQLLASAPGSATLTPSDLAAAALTLDSGETAGRAVTRADPADWQFHAIRSEAAVIAAAGLGRDDGAPPVDPDQLSLLQNLLDQVALALERARLEWEARGFAALRERNRVRSVLLATIGQELGPRLARIDLEIGELRRSGSGDRERLAAIGSETAKAGRYIANLADSDLEGLPEPIEADGVTIDLFQRRVDRGDVEVHLTPKEYAVLAELARHRGQVLTHAHLLRAAWGPAQEGQTEYLRVAVRGLRQKLEREPAKPKLILNEPAVGYRLV